MRLSSLLAQLCLLLLVPTVLSTRNENGGSSSPESNSDSELEAEPHNGGSTLMTGMGILRNASRKVSNSMVTLAKTSAMEVADKAEKVVKPAFAKIGGEILPKVIQRTAYVLPQLYNNVLIPAAHGASIMERRALTLSKAAYTKVKPHIEPRAKTFYEEWGVKPTWEASKEHLLRPFYNNVALPTMKKLARHTLTLGKWENGRGGGGEGGNHHVHWTSDESSTESAGEVGNGNHVRWASESSRDSSDDDGAGPGPNDAEPAEHAEELDCHDYELRYESH